MEGFKFVSKNKVSQLPKSAGVYCFKNKGRFYTSARRRTSGKELRTIFKNQVTGMAFL